MNFTLKNGETIFLRQIKANDYASVMVFIALYLKQGFGIEGRHVEASFINGKWCDEYSIAKILE